MTTPQQQTGARGEALAVNLLQEKGLQILATNWRWSRAEVDIIAQDGTQVVFIEVKTRNSTTYGHPEEFVSAKKQAWLAKAAGAWLEANNSTAEVRFDVISIILEGDTCHEIRHIIDAFFPIAD